jgi:transcriptional regulator with XRE-family HTH domain
LRPYVPPHNRRRVAALPGFARRLDTLLAWRCEKPRSRRGPADVARDAGLRAGVASLAALRAGRRPPTQAEVARLAAAMGVDFLWLACGHRGLPMTPPRLETPP